MSVSIYYRFKSSKDLSQETSALAAEWNQIFDGNPYEEWSWYEVTKDGDLSIYEGATALPMDSDLGMHAVFIATTLLSKLRKQVGGSQWCVNLDDMEFPWDEDSQSYTPGF